MEYTVYETDLLIIGGGTAGCYGALTAARLAPSVRVLIAEKANIRRSGCLAAGVNALNAYITPGHTPQDYVEYARKDAEGIIRDDLLLSLSKRFNRVAADLEQLGLVIQKDENGNYAARGSRNIKINGENIKPILADAVLGCPSISVLNHVNITDYLLTGRQVVGAVGFFVNDSKAAVIRARAVLCATGGAAGLYRPNNPGFSRHKMWYPPFNTGAGYAMGILAGAEMTTLEMRFIALRCKDTIAPTGTIAQGAGAKQVNSSGEIYETRYGTTTAERVYGTTREILDGHGPCYLHTMGITRKQDEELLKAYLNMAPAQTLKWLESGSYPSKQNVEIEGTEPYLVGGHTASGYWVDTGRRATLTGLYAAGDVSGGAPQKYVTGAMAEGEIAVETILGDLDRLIIPPAGSTAESIQRIIQSYEKHLTAAGSLYTAQQLEEAMQKVMDNYAGGIGASYRYNEAQLNLATDKIRLLSELCEQLPARDTDELLRVFELRERLVVCQCLIAHLAARKETRWPGFGENTDHPDQDDHWECYVNSRLENGEIRILYRPLIKGGETYEHSDRS